LDFARAFTPREPFLRCFSQLRLMNLDYFSMFRLFAPHALNGQKPIKQHALKGQKLLAQGSALGYFVRNLVAL